MPQANRSHDCNRHGGFTLVEVIAVLVLVGIMAAIAGMGLLELTRGYLMARENVAMAQKAQLALSRLNNEFLVCYDCIGNNSAIITAQGQSFTFDNVRGDNRVVDWTGNNVRINGNVLVDNVGGFNLSYDNLGRVEINLTLQHPGLGSTLLFTTGVMPRNLYQ